ncbi:metallophosphoesterase family protein [Devosia sp.]|uniref:metallophosphoesterase family protein n=1 Tax=Devosia sp. TaxID=1871048 RepID=UPI003264F9B8
MSRERISADVWPAVIYAIGDVHGCRNQLDQLLAQIKVDAADIAGEKWIVMLGDYVDRGPQSAGVLDLLCAAPPAGFKRICLAGNHEVMFLEFLDNPRTEADWLRYGGIETLQSYGIVGETFGGKDMNARRAILASHIPDEHIDLLKSLPVMISLPDTVFVHAGVRPGVLLQEQAEADLIWMREPFLGYDGALPYRVVHGHTPESDPVVLPHRIGIDTAAYATGVLTALKMTPGGAIEFFNTARSS